MIKPYSSILVYDTENAVIDGKISANTDVLRYIGAYSYKYDKYFFISPKNISLFQNLLKDHYVVVGYNNKEYDNVLLKRYGVSFEYKVMVDLYQVLNLKKWGGKERCAYIEVDGDNMKETLDSFSMASVAKWLKLSENKIEDFDYSILNKEVHTPEEESYIWNYLKQDLITTKSIFEFMDDYFDGLKPFLSEKDQNKMEHIRSTTATYAYKAICNATGLEEKYGSGDEIEFTGGKVYEPKISEHRGNIILLDFTALYIHIHIMCNLSSRVEDGSGWFGNGLFYINGRYNNKEHGKIPKVLQEWFNQRAIYKKNKDARQKGLKIFMLSYYGITGNPVFESVFDLTSAQDCTKLGQQWIELAKNRLEQNGYEFIYGDTDSAYIKDPFDDSERLKLVVNAIVKEIKDNVPFPSETFDFKFEDEIKFLKFFQKGDEGLKKKMYLYVNKNNELIVKGLQVKKSNTTKLSKKVFDCYIKEKIISELTCEFDMNFLKEIIFKELKEDISLALTPYRVKEKTFYKNRTSLQYQISERYGPGVHYLVKNHRYGIGKKEKYCKFEEFKGELKDLILDNVFDTELGDFVKKIKVENRWF